ncbi:ABC transporter substrate-binding protein [Spirochaeta dissipatitropha]
MKMRRIASIAIVLLLVAGMAFAGGRQESASGRVVVDTMAYGDNSNAEGVNWVRIVEEFEAANPDVKIQYELLYDEAYHQKVTARLAAGNVPDLAYMGADARWGLPWQEAGQQVDHRAWIDDSFYDMSLIPPMGPNGEVVQIPLGTGNITTVLYVNEALVKSLGYEVPTTYEEWVAIVPAARAAGLDVISINGADGWAWGSCFMSTIIARLSGDPNWVSKAVAGEHKFTDKVFVDSLAWVDRMIKDGVLASDSVLVDYGANVAKYTNEQALAMIQGQWIAGDISSANPAVANNTVLMPLPALPGESPATAKSVAAAIQVGYGITAKGSQDPAVRDAALRFIQYFYSHPETTQRLLDGAIVAPILKDFQVPAELSQINRRKVELAQNASMETDVIDAYLAGAANEALNAGMQQIASGASTPARVAEQVQNLLNN